MSAQKSEALHNAQSLVSGLKRKYGEDFHFCLNAHSEASHAWGFNANLHGVVEPTESTTLVQSQKCLAKVNLTESSRGLWKYGLRLESINSGLATPISIYDGKGFLNREEAIEDAKKASLRFFQRELTYHSSLSNREGLQKVITTLENPTQLEFF